MNESVAWTGHGFRLNSGLLTLEHGRLRFEVLDEAIEQVLFDAPVGELKIAWLWYRLGWQFWAHANGERYLMWPLHPGNVLGSWRAGIEKGRGWKRAILEAEKFNKENPK